MADTNYAIFLRALHLLSIIWQNYLAVNRRNIYQSVVLSIWQTCQFLVVCFADSQTCRGSVGQRLCRANGKVDINYIFSDIIYINLAIMQTLFAYHQMVRYTSAAPQRDHNVKSATKQVRPQLSSWRRTARQQSILSLKVEESKVKLQ